VVSGGAGVGVELQGVQKRFVERRTMRDWARAPFARRWHVALDDVSLSVAPGEFFGLLGPNGAGKSTLFKILSTLVLPDGGRAAIGGYTVTEQPASVRGLISPVSADERSLWWRLSAIENLRLFGALHGLSRRDADRRADAVLALVRLEGTGARMVGAFSSGMRQRLLVARALMGTPRVLLLDEPTRSLDPISARDLRLFLRDELNRRLGCTILLATHSHEEALDCCERVGVLHRGRLLASGSRADLVRSLGDDRYRLLAAPTAAAALAVFAADGRVRAVIPQEPQEGEWRRWIVEIPGGEGAAADVLALLVRDGVAVAGLERLEPNLADLLERVVARDTAPEVQHA